MIPILGGSCDSDGVSGAKNRSRGRPRGYDEEAVWDQLTALFGAKGYTQTTMADLVDATGVHTSSLYATFGTKEELFAKVLRRYMTARIEMFATVIQTAGPGVDGIHAFLEAARTDAVSGSGQQGCLLNTTCSELRGTTPSFEDFGVEYRTALRQQLRMLIKQAEPENSPNPVLTDQRTDVVFAFLLGLDRIARGGSGEAEIGRLIDAMGATVDTWRS